jgi:ribosomal protein L10
MTEHEYMRKWAEQNDSAIKSDVHTLFKERDAALADYQSLERQYTDLNRLWEAQGREITVLRNALLHLADTARSADRLIDYTFKNARDVHAGLDHAIEQAQRVLSKEAT